MRLEKLDFKPKTRRQAVAFAVVGIAALVLLVGTQLGASDDAGSPAAPTEKTTDGDAARSRAPRAPAVVSPTRLLSTFAILTVALVGALWLGSRWLRRTRLAPSGEKVLEVLDAVPLGPKRQVWVLRAWDRHIVVGASENSIAVLCELDADEVAAATNKGVANVTATDFAGRLEAVEAPELTAEGVAS